MLACAIAVVSASMSGAALAQVPPGQYGPGQYTPYQPIPQPGPGQFNPYQPNAQPGPGQYNPYPQAQPGPYAQPLPYGGAQGSPPGYVPLGGGNEDYTSDRAHSWAVLRASLGAGAQFAPRKPTLVAFLLDATAGFRWAFAPRASLALEAGFSYDSEPGRGGMYGTLGAGPELYVARYLQIGWDPKLVLGGAWSGFAIGVRNTLIVSALMHAVSLEIGHQYLRVGTEDRQELRAQVGFDVAGLAQLLLTQKLTR